MDRWMTDAIAASEVMVIEITGRLDDSEEVALALEVMAERIREDDDVRATALASALNAVATSANQGKGASQ